MLKRQFIALTHAILLPLAGAVAAVAVAVVVGAAADDHHRR
ncbi:hypothetical protein [Actinoplanes sp. NPDC049265]